MEETKAPLSTRVGHVSRLALAVTSLSSSDELLASCEALLEEGVTQQGDLSPNQGAEEGVTKQTHLQRQQCCHRFGSLSSVISSLSDCSDEEVSLEELLVSSSSSSSEFWSLSSNVSSLASSVSLDLSHLGTSYDALDKCNPRYSLLVDQLAEGSKQQHCAPVLEKNGTLHPCTLSSRNSLCNNGNKLRVYPSDCRGQLAGNSLSVPCLFTQEVPADSGSKRMLLPGSCWGRGAAPPLAPPDGSTRVECGEGAAQAIVHLRTHSCDHPDQVSLGAPRIPPLSLRSSAMSRPRACSSRPEEDHQRDVVAGLCCSSHHDPCCSVPESSCSETTVSASGNSYYDQYFRLASTNDGLKVLRRDDRIPKMKCGNCMNADFPSTIEPHYVCATKCSEHHSGNDLCFCRSDDLCFDSVLASKLHAEYVRKCNRSIVIPVRYHPYRICASKSINPNSWKLNNDFSTLHCQQSTSICSKKCHHDAIDLLSKIHLEQEECWKNESFHLVWEDDLHSNLSEFENLFEHHLSKNLYRECAAEANLLSLYALCPLQLDYRSDLTSGSNLFVCGSVPFGLYLSDSNDEDSSSNFSCRANQCSIGGRNHSVPCSNMASNITTDCTVTGGDEHLVYTSTVTGKSTMCPNPVNERTKLYPDSGSGCTNEHQRTTNDQATMSNSTAPEAALGLQEDQHQVQSAGRWQVTLLGAGTEPKHRASEICDSIKGTCGLAAGCSAQADQEVTGCVRVVTEGGDVLHFPVISSDPVPSASPWTLRAEQINQWLREINSSCRMAHLQRSASESYSCTSRPKSEHSSRLYAFKLMRNEKETVRKLLPYFIEKSKTESNYVPFRSRKLSAGRLESVKRRSDVCDVLMYRDAAPCPDPHRSTASVDDDSSQKIRLCGIPLGNHPITTGSNIFNSMRRCADLQYTSPPTSPLLSTIGSPACSPHRRVGNRDNSAPPGTLPVPSTARSDSPDHTTVPQGSQNSGDLANGGKRQHHREPGIALRADRRRKIESGGDQPSDCGPRTESDFKEIHESLRNEFSVEFKSVSSSVSEPMYHSINDVLSSSAAEPGAIINKNTVFCQYKHAAPLGYDTQTAAMGVPPSCVLGRPPSTAETMKPSSFVVESGGSIPPSISAAPSSDGHEKFVCEPLAESLLKLQAITARNSNSSDNILLDFPSGNINLQETKSSPAQKSSSTARVPKKATATMPRLSKKVAKSSSQMECSDQYNPSPATSASGEGSYIILPVTLGNCSHPAVTGVEDSKVQSEVSLMESVQNSPRFSSLKALCESAYSKLEPHMLAQAAEPQYSGREQPTSSLGSAPLRTRYPSTTGSTPATESLPSSSSISDSCSAVNEMSLGAIVSTSLSTTTTSDSSETSMYAANDIPCNSSVAVQQIRPTTTPTSSQLPPTTEIPAVTSKIFVPPTRKQLPASPRTSHRCDFNTTPNTKISQMKPPSNTESFSFTNNILVPAELSLPSLKSPLPASQVLLPASQVPLPASQVPLPASQVPLPASQVSLPAFQVPLPASQAPLPVSQVPLPTSQVPLPTSQVPLPTSQVPLPTSQVPLPASQVPLPASQVSLLASQAPPPSSQALLPGSQALLPGSQALLPGSQALLPASQAPLSASQVLLSTSQVPLSASQVPLSASQVPLSASQVPLSASQVPLSASQVPLSAAQVTLPASETSLTAIDVAHDVKATLAETSAFQNEITHVTENTVIRTQITPSKSEIIKRIPGVSPDLTEVTEFGLEVTRSGPEATRPDPELTPAPLEIVPSGSEPSNISLHSYNIPLPLPNVLFSPIPDRPSSATTQPSLVLDQHLITKTTDSISETQTSPRAETLPMYETTLVTSDTQDLFTEMNLPSLAVSSAFHIPASDATVDETEVLRSTTKDTRLTSAAPRCELEVTKRGIVGSKRTAVKQKRVTPVLSSATQAPSPTAQIPSRKIKVPSCASWDSSQANGGSSHVTGPAQAPPVAEGRETLADIPLPVVEAPVPTVDLHEPLPEFPTLAKVMPTSVKKKSTLEKKVPSGAKELLPSEKKVPTLAKEMPTLAKEVPIPSEEVPIPAEEVPIPAGEVPIPADEVPIPADEVHIPAEEVPIPADEVPIPAEEVPAPAKEVPTPAKEVPAPAKEVPAPAKEVPAPAKEVPAPAKEVPTPAKEVPAPAKEVPAPAKEVPAPAVATGVLIAAVETSVPALPFEAILSTGPTPELLQYATRGMFDATIRPSSSSTLSASQVNEYSQIKTLPNLDNSSHTLQETSPPTTNKIIPSQSNTPSTEVDDIGCRNIKTHTKEEMHVIPIPLTASSLKKPMEISSVVIHREQSAPPQCLSEPSTAHEEGCIRNACSDSRDERTAPDVQFSRVSRSPGADPNRGKMLSEKASEIARLQGAGPTKRRPIAFPSDIIRSNCQVAWPQESYEKDTLTLGKATFRSKSSSPMPTDRSKRDSKERRFRSSPPLRVLKTTSIPCNEKHSDKTESFQLPCVSSVDSTPIIVTDQCKSSFVNTVYVDVSPTFSNTSEISNTCLKSPDENASESSISPTIYVSNFARVTCSDIPCPGNVTESDKTVNKIARTELKLSSVTTKRNNYHKSSEILMWANYLADKMVLEILDFSSPSWLQLFSKKVSEIIAAPSTRTNVRVSVENQTVPVSKLSDSEVSHGSSLHYMDESADQVSVIARCSGESASSADRRTGTEDASASTSGSAGSEAWWSPGGPVQRRDILPEELESSPPAASWTAPLIPPRPADSDADKEGYASDDDFDAMDEDMRRLEEKIRQFEHELEEDLEMSLIDEDVKNKKMPNFGLLDKAKLRSSPLPLKYPPVNMTRTKHLSLMPKKEIDEYLDSESDSDSKSSGSSNLSDNVLFVKRKIKLKPGDRRCFSLDLQKRSFIDECKSEYLLKMLSISRTNGKSERTNSQSAKQTSEEERDYLPTACLAGELQPDDFKMTGSYWRSEDGMAQVDSEDLANFYANTIPSGVFFIFEDDSDDECDDDFQCPQELARNQEKFAEVTNIPNPLFSVSVPQEMIEPIPSSICPPGSPPSEPKKSSKFVSSFKSSFVKATKSIGPKLTKKRSKASNLDSKESILTKSQSSGIDPAALMADLISSEEQSYRASPGSCVGSEKVDTFTLSGDSGSGDVMSGQYRACPAVCVTTDEENNIPEYKLFSENPLVQTDIAPIHNSGQLKNANLNAPEPPTRRSSLDAVVAHTPPGTLNRRTDKRINGHSQLPSTGVPQIVPPPPSVPPRTATLNFYPVRSHPISIGNKVKYDDIVDASSAGKPIDSSSNQPDADGGHKATSVRQLKRRQLERKLELEEEERNDVSGCSFCIRRSRTLQDSRHNRYQHRRCSPHPRALTLPQRRSWPPRK